MNYTQIANLFLQGALVVFVVLLLFRLRRRLGIGVLFACLGLFQFMQVFLSSTVYVSVYKNLLVSPGSSVLFTASLFVLLIIYIKEDAIETKNIIYALLIVNIVMSVLLYTLSWYFKDTSIYNPFNVSAHLFNNNAWVLFVGTVALFLDSLLIIIIYEFLNKHLRFLFLRILLTMLIVIGFDSIFFAVLAFWNFDTKFEILFSGLISKGTFTLFYTVLFYIYLKYFDAKEETSKIYKIKDVFQPLTYRQKYETAEQYIKEAEELIKIKDIRYQTLTDNSPVGIFHTLEDGYTTYVNSRWCEISGIKKEDAIGWGWISAVHPEDKQVIQQGWESAVQEKRMSQVSYRFILSDGSINWVLGLAVPEYNSQQEIIGYVGTITDITELKLYEQEQTYLRKKADESNRLKSAFLANMSHEIRTPMNGILGFAELLQNPGLSEELQQSYFELIRKSGVRMLTLLNDIINISKIESGVVDVKLIKCNINEQQEYIYSLFKPEADEKKIHFSYNSSLPTESAFIKTDQNKFISIYSNLIKNALKFTDEGSVEFGYHIKDNFVEFYIKDTGIGIDPKRQGAIFDRFVQADIEDKLAKQGAGLGLSISKAFVEMLGGKIWLESEKGKGSVFYFTLPYNNKTT
ncbi:MAG: ATP-binding protein [Paludibacter sp.]|nr:ATP-binding protein [Paludibacter sp.]